MLEDILKILHIIILWNTLLRQNNNNQNMDATITITGLDKGQLLYYMWKGQVVAGFFTASGITPPDFDKSAADKAVLDYIDYFKGRAIKTDLSGDTVDPWLYDRDAGKGAFAKIVSAMRAATAATATK